MALPALLDAVVAGVSVAAEAKRIAVECRIAGDLPPIEGDPKRLQQVLNNVLVNAVKFTPEGGAITRRQHASVAARSRSRFATPASASRPTSCPTSSIASGRPTAARRGITAASAWAWPSPAT